MRFRFSEGPIVTESVRRELADLGAGGYVSFEGWVRDFNEGREVTRLEYEPISIGVKSVSAAITRTRPSWQPSPSAAICATIVSEPWPISDAPV